MPQIFRVCAAALALTSLSFVTGVAGDLSQPPPVHGVAVVVPIPPLVAADSAPPGPLPRTAAALARPARAGPARLTVAEPSAAAPEPAIDAFALVAEHELFHSAPADLALLEAPKSDLG